MAILCGLIVISFGALIGKILTYPLPTTTLPYSFIEGE